MRRQKGDGPRWGRGYRGLLVFTTLATGGCHLVGSMESPRPVTADHQEAYPSLEGRYRGILTIDGGELIAQLLLTQEGERGLRGLMELPSALQAEGRGERNGWEIRMEMAYGGECPGRMTLTGRWEPGSGVLTGLIRAADCTGNADGTFHFSRTPSPRNP